jgi:hypothetical protein
MRSKFPYFWILQLLLLTGLGFISLFAPQRVVEFCRGEKTPQRVRRPVEALNDWVVGLEEVPVPNKVVRNFFDKHERDPQRRRKVWTPNDPSIKQFTWDNGPGNWLTAQTENRAWTAVIDWLLSCQPPPRPQHAERIREWLYAVDEFQEPPRKLRDAVKNHEDLDEPELPTADFRRFILSGRQTLPKSWRLAAGQVRLSAACMLAAALFTLFGLLSPSIRRPLARCFVLMMLVLTVSLLLSTLGPPHWNMTFGVVVGGLILAGAMLATAVHAVPKLTTGRVLWAVLAVWWLSIIFQASVTPHETGSTVGQTSMIVVTSALAVLGIVNAHYWLIGPREDPPQDDAGISQRRPPQLWTLWLLQFAIVLAVGVGTLVFPKQTANLFTDNPFDYLNTDVVQDSVRMLGAWMIALALFSYFALGVAQDWMWQGIGWLFCTVFGVLALGTLFNALSGMYSYWGYLYGFQGIAFVPATVLMLMKRDPWSTINVERVRRHWSLADLTVIARLMWAPLWHGRRALYTHGVGARGRLRVLPRPKHAGPDAGNVGHELVGVPGNAFFQDNREFRVEARFANRTQEDDAALDIRGCALRLSDGHERLDLLFATGAFAPASSLLDFRRLLPHSDIRRGVLKHKVVREGLAAGMRRAPASFADLSYFHPLALEWLTPNAESYLVRFRLVPREPVLSVPNAAGVRDALGLPDAEDLQHLWQQERRPSETRDGDYLRRELHDRLANGRTVSFQLEMQFHLPDRDDSLDWYDASLEWDERAFPWRPLAELVLDRPLNEEESEALQFDPARLPASLLVPLPDNENDVCDQRSLGAAQFRVAGSLGRLRAWRTRPPASHDAAPPPPPSAESSDPVAAESSR